VPKKKKQTLFKKPKHKKYAKIIKFDTPDNAEKAMHSLLGEFIIAKQNAKRLRIARTLTYSANRAEASSRRKKISVKERKEFLKIAGLYHRGAHIAWREYNKIKKS